MDRQLFKVLQDLGDEEYEQFLWFLEHPGDVDGFKAIPKSKLKKAKRHETVDLMVQTYDLPGALEVTIKVLKEIPRNDLVERLSKSASEPNNLLVQRQKHQEDITHYQRTLQSNLQDKFMCTPEGLEMQKDKKLVKDIFTDVYIIDGVDEVDVNRQHEVRSIEMKAKKPRGAERSIQHNDIFQHPSGENMPVRSVLTYGDAGIGKTFHVYKFILDWAEGRANQDVQLIFPFTCGKLNLLSQSGKKFSLVDLVLDCIVESRFIGKEALNNIFTNLQSSGNTNYDKSTFKLLFVFDGLDENCLQLDFSEQLECSVDEPLLVNELLANLIKGKLLPSARLWITTRPAAANQIPVDSVVDIMTVVRGFTDTQKEEYFRKRFDVEQATRIISHIKTSPSLHIMCHVPVFCWITATVLKEMFEEDESKQIPKTLTEMCIYFLKFQIMTTKRKYNKDKASDVIHSLAKFAFEELKRENVIFHETDLISSGICSNEATVYSGVFTQIFEKNWLSEEKTFCFVHLIIHEFLAAVSVVVSAIDDTTNESSITEVCMEAVDEALQSPNGHLDLFLRFLLGLTLQSNQVLLGDLLKRTESSETMKEELVAYIKKKISETSSSERRMNLVHCLSELEDSSLVEEVQHNQRAALKPSHDSSALETAGRRTTEHARERGTGDGSEDGLVCLLSSDISKDSDPQEDIELLSPRSHSPVKGSVDVGEVLKDHRGDDACGHSDTLKNVLLSDHHCQSAITELGKGNLDRRKRPEVEFVGEQAKDDGGPTRELAKSPQLN